MEQIIKAKTTFGLPDEIFVFFGRKAQPSGQDGGLTLLVLQGHLFHTHRLRGKNQQDVVKKYVNTSKKGGKKQGRAGVNTHFAKAVSCL
jgi:hypothetical protein